MNTPLQNVKLSERQRRMLDLVLASPKAKEILSEEEAKNVAARQALVDEMAALPAKEAAAKKAAEIRCAAAVVALEKAERAVREARAEHLAASAGVMVADNSRRSYELARELRKTADPRLQAAWLELDRREGILPALYGIGLHPLPSAGFGQRFEFYSNADEIKIARDALRGAKDRLESLGLLALTRSQITAHLQAIIKDVSGPLTDLGLKTFGLDEEEEVISQSNRAWADECEGIMKAANARAA